MTYNDYIRCCRYGDVVPKQTYGFVNVKTGHLEPLPCENNTTKKEKPNMERKVEQVIFLAPSINYAKKVRTSLANDLDKAGIPHHEYERGGTILIRTDKVNVEFIFADPVRWTRDMFMEHDAILGKRELIDTLNAKFKAGCRYNSSLSKYIRDLHFANTPKEEKPRTSYLPEITNVYFNDPVTVVLWDDGTKTIVKCQDGDVYSEETGLSLCITKKALGNMPNFNNVFRKWVPDHEADGAALIDRIVKFYEDNPSHFAELVAFANEKLDRIRNLCFTHPVEATDNKEETTNG